MARRRATRKYETLIEFLVDYNESISRNSIQLPKGSFRGELANAIKLDLSIPEIGRVGPIVAQVVFREAGSAALRLPELPHEIHGAATKVKEMIASQVKPFVDCGLVVSKQQYDQEISQLKQELSELEARLLEEKEVAVQEAIQQGIEQQQVLAEKLAEAQAAASAAVATGGSPGAKVFSRGFPVPNYQHLEPEFEGTLNGGALQSSLLQISASKTTGLLVIETDTGKRYGYFDKGGVVGWKSDPLNEREVLGMLLFKAKQINEEQLKTSLKVMEEKGVRQGEAFIKMGVMNFSQLVMVLGKQVDFIFHQVRKLTSGEFAFYAFEDLPERFVPPPLSVPEILFRDKFAQARRSSVEEVQKSYARQFNSYLSYSPVAEAVLPEMNLTKPERQLVNIIKNNSWRMREVFSVSPMAKGSTSAFIWAFHQLGFFNYGSKESDQRLEARFEGRFSRKFRQLNGGSHFDILEIHWICLPQEIEDAYQKAVAFFDPKKNKAMPKQFHDRAKNILQRINEAYSFVKNDKSRREYRLKLIEKEMILQSASLLAKKGEMAVLRKDRREACSCFSKALELIPTSQEYRDGLRRSTMLNVTM